MVAQRIVDGLEVIEVEKQHGGAPLLLVRWLQQGRQLLQQVVPVGQVRERVVQGNEGFALLGLLARGEVVQHDDTVVGVLQRHGLADGLDGNGVPVLVGDGDFVGVFAPVARVLQRHGAPFGFDEAEDRLAQHLGQRVTDEPLQGLVAVDDEAIAVEDDGLVGGLGELAHALLALAHCVLGAPALGDVIDQDDGTNLMHRAAEVGDEVDLDDACIAVEPRLFAHVSHPFALDAPLHVGLDGKPGLFANDLLNGHAQDGFGAVAVEGGISLVGESAAQVGQVEVGHQRGHGVRDQAQQRVAVLPGGWGLGIVRGV